MSNNEHRKQGIFEEGSERNGMNIYPPPAKDTVKDNIIDRTQPLIPVYHPDSYQFIRISSRGDDDSIIKLFAVWNGSYLDSDSWKMNSGCTKITQDNIFDNLYIVEGYSGSRYVINKASSNLSSYGIGVLTDIINRAEKTDVVVEMISLDEAVGEVEQ